MTIRGLCLRLTYPFRRRALDRELREEIALHVALPASELERSGLPPHEAARAARKKFGNQSRIVSARHSAWGWHWLDGFEQDLRYIARQLRRRPTFALVACLTIALGIAINTTAFTFYDVIALRPIAVAEPRDLVRVIHDVRAVNWDVLPYAAYDVLNRDAHTRQSVVATTSQRSFAVILPGHAADDPRVALAGLVLASVGVYGLISQIVTRRTREIGVHLAIGARPIQVIRLVAWKTLRPVMWGAALGGIGAL